MRKRQTKKNQKKLGVYQPSLFKFTQRMCRRIALKTGARGYRLRGNNHVAAFIEPSALCTIPGTISWHTINPLRFT